MPAPLIIVDDDPACFHSIEALLYGEGYDLHYVRDSATAFETILQMQPQIVLSDLMMPKVTGMELCQALKASAETRDIPIILLTALEDEEYLTRCLEAGADDFLSKRVSAPELRARIRSMLRIRAHYDLLRRSMNLREDFAHIVIHDLGNPLSTLTMEVDDLLAHQPRPDQLLSLQVLQKNVRRLREMTHDMLLLAKIDQGKLHLDSRPYDMAAAITEAVHRVEPLAHRRKLSLRVIYEAAPLPAVFDQALLLRVLDNILSNAIKFSPPAGTIEVRAAPILRAGEKGVRVEVEDEGSGVPEEFREKVFEKFEVGQVRRDIPQVGLGLAFCKTAIEAHGGTITLGDGKRGGTVVRFEI